MKQKEMRNSIVEKTAAEPLNDEVLGAVNGGRRLEISFDVNKKSDLHNYNNQFDQAILNTNNDLDGNLQVNNAADGKILTDGYVLYNKTQVKTK